MSEPSLVPTADIDSDACLIGRFAATKVDAARLAYRLGMLRATEDIADKPAPIADKLASAIAKI